VTGLIKTILMLEREQILPNSGFETPNKRIPLDKWNLQVFEVKTHSELNVNSNVDSHEVLALDSQEWGFEGIN
jgi:acyl transferase domain-containing protein